MIRALWHAQVSLGNYDKKQYCSSVRLGSLTPAAREGTYAQFVIPISAFQCPFAASGISQIRLQNSAGQAVAFCLDEIAITSGSSSASVGRRHLF